MEKKKNNTSDVMKKIVIISLIFIVIEAILFCLSEFLNLLTYVYLGILFLFPIIFSLYISAKYFEKKEVLYKTAIITIVLFLAGSLVNYLLYYMGFGVIDVLFLINILLGNLMFILILIGISLILGVITFLLSLIIYFKKS
jgi:hypothetical protein